MRRNGGECVEEWRGVCGEECVEEWRGVCGGMEGSVWRGVCGGMTSEGLICNRYKAVKLYR